MPNSLLTPSVIAAQSLRILRNKMVVGGLVHRSFKKEFVKVGDTVTIRKPVKFSVSDGATRVNQDVTETSTSIVINKRKHI
ncbi:MAG: P22 phage major capsid protein family protein, partial [Gammaproteobacteria bacterium]